jgi:uncharacterized membrane protein
MNFNWRYFVAAVLITALLLLKIGAPPVAVGLGIGGAALFMWRRASHSS